MIGINASHLAANVFSSNSELSKSILRLSLNKKLTTDSPSHIIRAERFKRDINASSSLIDSLQEQKEAFGIASEAAGKVLAVLQDMRELAVTASDPTMTDAERAILNASEFRPMQAQIDGVADTTRFNDTVLADGGWLDGGGLDLVVGHDPTADTLTIQMGGGTAFDLNSAALAVGTGTINISVAGNPEAAIAAIDTAIDTVAGFQGTLGVAANSMDRFVELHQVVRSNTESALSIVEGVDVAFEMVNYTKRSVVQQASIAMLAQGNMANQNMLALFA